MRLSRDFLLLVLLFLFSAGCQPILFFSTRWNLYLRFTGKMNFLTGASSGSTGWPVTLTGGTLCPQFWSILIVVRFRTIWKESVWLWRGEVTLPSLSTTNGWKTSR